MSVSVRPIVKIKLAETLKGWPYTDGQVYPFKEEAVLQLEESFKHELELRGATHVGYEIVGETIVWQFEDAGHQCQCILTPYLWDRRLETKVEFKNL